MKQTFNTHKGIGTFNVPLPTPADNELLVAVYASVISTGTETIGMRKGEKTLYESLQEKIEIFEKVTRVVKEKGLGRAIEVIKNKLDPSEKTAIYKPMGYSNAGIIVAKGRLVKGFNIGDHVACAGAGIASHAEFTSVPVNLAVNVPEHVLFDSAAFATLGAIAMQGIRRANVTFGETVVITGLGLLGLIAVQIAKAWGLTVIGSDINPARLDLAKELGADFCFNAYDKDFIRHIISSTNGSGADAVIIYASTKSSVPANLALETCRKKGRVVVVGSIGMDLQREAMYEKELDFVISTSYGPGRYDSNYELRGIDYPIGYVRWTENRNMMEFIKLLSVGSVKVDRLISVKYGIDQAAEAYKSLVETPGENISCVFNYLHDETIIPPSRMEVESHVSVTGQIGIGIIGAGSFIQKNHLANILGMPEDYRLVGIAEKTPASARTLSEKYPVDYVTTDYKQLLKDPTIDLIVIGTRHNLHAIQVVDAINAGKNVLVEKPLALDYNELSMIEKAISENNGVISAVGFNRRYSPFIQKAKEIIMRNEGPAVINYRINAGYFPPEIWVQDLEEGGGRIIGEVCHFIDLLAYLTSDKIIDLNVISIPTNGKSIHSEDNVIVSISFENGSIGVITYTSIGAKDMEKERIEIFKNGCSVVINDFIELQTFNCNEGSFKLKRTDKGHKALISELSRKLRNEPSLILPFETDIEMTRLTLRVADQINQIKHSVN